MAGKPRIANKEVDDRMAKLAEQLSVEKNGKTLNTVNDLTPPPAPVKEIKTVTSEKEKAANEKAANDAMIAAEAEASRKEELRKAQEEGIEKGKVVAKKEIEKEKSHNDIPDYLKEGSEFKATKAAPVDKEKEADDKIKELLEIQRKYNELISDPIISGVAEFRRSGGEDISEFASKVSIPSFEGKSDEDKYSFYLKTTEPDISEDDLEEAIADFESLPAVERRAKLKTVDAEINKLKEGKLKSYQTSAKEKDETRKAQEIFFQEKTQEGIKVLDQTLTEMKGTQAYGYELTPDDITAIHEYSLSRTAIKKDEKGNFAGFDIDKTIDEALFLIPTIRRKILLENLNLGKRLGEEAAIEKRKRAASVSSDNYLLADEGSTSGIDKAIEEVRTSLRKKGKMEQSVNR